MQTTCMGVQGKQKGPFLPPTQNKCVLINAKSHFQAEQFVDAARLFWNTISILIMYGSEKYLHVSEPASKHYKREPVAMFWCWGIKLCFLGFSQQFSSPVLLSCVPAHTFLAVWYQVKRSSKNIQEEKAFVMMEMDNFWLNSVRMSWVEIGWYPVM